MNESLIILLILGGLIFTLIAAILGLVAFIILMRKGRSEKSISDRVKRLARRVQQLEAAAEIPEKAPEKPAGAEEQTVSPEEGGSPEPETTPPEEREPERPEQEAVEVAEQPEPAEDAQSGPSILEWFEKSMGEKWIAWVGALVIFFAVAFFVKYAIDSGWLGPTARCILGVVVGIIMAVAGNTCLRRDMRGLGQGLVGSGLGILYLSIFAAFQYYELMPQAAAFGFMALISAGGMALAALHNALPIAFIAVLGGLLTPVLCSTGQDSRDALFSYLMVLNLGVLGISFFRRWRALDVLAMVGTWVLFGAWYEAFYFHAAVLPAVIWLVAFFVTFLLLPFAFYLRARQRVPIEQFVMGLVHAAVFFGFAYDILHPDYDHVLGFIAVGLAAVYCVLGGGVRRRTGGARELFGFVGLAMIFLTIAVPLQMGIEGTLIAWVAEAVVLVYLGYRFDYLPVRVGGFVVLGVAAVRLFSVHWPLHTAEFRLFLNTSFGTALCVPIGAAALVWLHRRWQQTRGRLDEVMQEAASIGACLVLLVILHGEVGLWLKYARVLSESGNGDFYAQASRAFIWTAGSLLMLAGGVKWDARSLRLAGLPALAVALFCAWGLYGHDIDPDLIFANARFLACMGPVCGLFIWGTYLGREESNLEVTAGAVIHWTGVIVFFLLLSFESWHYADSMASTPRETRWIGLMALSVTWGCYAGGLLVSGFWLRKRGHRLAALTLFGITGLKLVIVDMAGVGDIYRVVSFLAIGLLMIGASYLYQKAEKRIMKTEEEA